MNISPIFPCVVYTPTPVDLGRLFERLQQAERRTAELTVELSSVLSQLHNGTGTTDTNCSRTFGEEDGLGL